MDKFFEKIARLPAVLKVGVLCGTVAVIFAGFYFGVAGGSGAKTDETKELANLKRAKQEFAQAERSKAEEKQECESLKKKLKKAKRKMRRFRGMLPDDPSISALIKDIKAKLSGLALVDYARREEIKRKIYAMIPLDLTVVGPFHSAIKFFHEVSVMPRIVNVTDVSLTDAEVSRGKTNMKVSFRVSTFRYLRRGGQKKKTTSSGGKKPGQRNQGGKRK
ncbi:MAG: type 4a pilus biogenesis protein PilO [bacterium]